MGVIVVRDKKPSRLMPSYGSIIISTSLYITLFLSLNNTLLCLHLNFRLSKNDQGSAEDQTRECSEVLIVGRAGPRWSQIKGR